MALSTFGLVRVPAAPVEVLVAASILVTAVHAIRPIFPRREPLIGLTFGLVHGLAFASALEELGVHGRALALSLLGFNLGIEAMQLALVVLVMPLLVLSSRGGSYARVRPVGAIVAGLAAVFFLAQRLFPA